MRWLGTDASLPLRIPSDSFYPRPNTLLRGKQILKTVEAGYGVYKDLRFDRHHPTPPDRLPSVDSGSYCLPQKKNQN